MNNVELAAEIAKLHTQVNGLLVMVILVTLVNFSVFMMLPYHFVEKKK